MFAYDGVIKQSIKQVKYRLVSEAIKELLSIIPYEQKESLLLYKKLGSDWTVIPVPLHTSRLKKRGFNQAEKLGEYFANSLSFPLNDTIMKRIKSTLPQAQFRDKKQRFENIKNAFVLTSKISIKGKNFIICDDVFTTGGTIFEIAKLLKKNGAAKVMGLTLAR
jgi:ComF family protein